RVFRNSTSPTLPVLATGARDEDSDDRGRTARQGGRGWQRGDQPCRATSKTWAPGGDLVLRRSFAFSTMAGAFPGTGVCFRGLAPHPAKSQAIRRRQSPCPQRRCLWSSAKAFSIDGAATL